jgi:hypothetical protein
VSNPSRPQLTEESLLQLEQSLPGYRLAHCNLHHWFFYIESTFQDSFDTYRDFPDRDYYPSCFDSPGSQTPLSQADFQETHHSSAGSTDLFRNTIRQPQEIQVVIPSHTSSGLPHPRSTIPPDSIESNSRSSLSESALVLPKPALPEPALSKPPLPASTFTALAEFPLQSSEPPQQPVDFRQSQSRTCRRSPSSSGSSYHPHKTSPPQHATTSPLPLRRRITRSQSQHVSRAVIDPSAEVISLSDDS